MASAASYGCYSLVSDISGKSTSQYMSSGKCIEACPDSPYVAVQNYNCYCLNLPPSDLLKASTCLTTCPGYNKEMCGGSNAFTVYSGNAEYVPNASVSQTSLLLTLLVPSNLQPTSNLPASLEAPTATQTTATTVVSHAPSSLPLSGTEKQTQANASAIAGGVVGGLAGLGFIAAAIFFFVRRRRIQQETYDLEEEAYFDKPGGAGAGVGAMQSSPSFTRNSSRTKPVPSAMDMPLTNPFIHPADSLAPGGLRGLADPRMNPAMMGRQRISTGLLADEADYSRKILQVVNPDHSNAY